MRIRSTGIAGLAVLAALAAVLLSGCELREGAASEYGSSESGYGVKNVNSEQNELAKQIIGSGMRKF
ncbi:MAG: hypothetical protein GEV28_39870 [Actinophytocola sp.]|uniref:hypothetical protein n=1 Tax=Actinophytocola sp. TaxID=1872138 RepID=UPI001324B1F6|nr:hypothetical protein [Actinophytocola sp.]MPZ86204.1 hypothetical protein [Actinophytocola sp.]